MRRRNVTWIVDRDRATDRVGDLQASIEARVGEQDALTVSELDGRYVGLGGNARDAFEELAVFVPAPAMRLALELVGGHAAGRHLAGARLAARIGKPGPLCRRVHLGPDP